MAPVQSLKVALDADALALAGGQSLKVALDADALAGGHSASHSKSRLTQMPSPAVTR